MHIIVQAGGKGTRLEKYTRNKPKCLVSVNNRPILFYALDAFPDATFHIICDYRRDVLERYLRVFGKQYDYSLVLTDDKGTCAGIRAALKEIPAGEPVLLMWSDLILPQDWKLPADLSHDYIGISKEFECRWSYVDGNLLEQPSSEYGVAGLFLFARKEEIEDVDLSGAFTVYLQRRNFPFRSLPLYGTHEVGTILSYEEIDDRSNKCRPFNQMEFDGDVVIKTGITEKGRKLAVDEAAWYRKAQSLGYRNMPKIYAENPLRMERVRGKNIFDYPNLDREQKEELLGKIVCALQDLHERTAPIDCREEDVYANYFQKTFDRIRPVQDLIPFAHDESIRINGVDCRNVFFMEDEIRENVRKWMPEKFHFIHGDNTFSNIMFDQFQERVVLIDPRGYFGKTHYYGDADYDWAKLYYSIAGNYDQFNRKNFTLVIGADDVQLTVGSNGWEDVADEIFQLVPELDAQKICFLHALIWISLTTYAWEDYDSVCGAFYNGLWWLHEVLEAS